MKRILMNLLVVATFLMLFWFIAGCATDWRYGDTTCGYYWRTCKGDYAKECPNGCWKDRK